MSTMVIGVGERMAGDDAVGLCVAEAVGGATMAEPTGLLDWMARAGRLVVVDAVVDGGPAGRGHVLGGCRAAGRQMVQALLRE
ncbi:MAG: hypothetical protein ACYCW6_23595 [Candidatus Xenobia bacterium]